MRSPHVSLSRISARHERSSGSVGIANLFEAVRKIWKIWIVSEEKGRR